MKIRVRSANESTEFQISPGAKLLDYLNENNVYVNSSCGGNGTCHKCRIQIVQGFLAQTPADRRAFRESELSKGWRLSCQAVPKTSLAIQVPEVENLRGAVRVELGIRSYERAHFVCDLGSTGVVVALVNEKGEILSEAHSLNAQIKYGADVMTRLQYAQKNGVEPLHLALLKTLDRCLTALEKVDPGAFSNAMYGKIICSGNSAMVSLLHKWNIDTLATSPFQPIRTEMAEFPWKVTIQTLPLLSGFVGADTFAGIYFLESKALPKPWMMVDIGTNTEIVIAKGNGEYWYSSAPAGPAFEGGNITKGMRAEPGAIAHATFKSKRWTTETIGNDRALGICGSGLIDILASGLKEGLITQDGYLETPLEITDEIGIFPDDIREFQLAKSATRTACEILMQRAGLRPREIYLAGTFAQHLDLDSVKKVGLLPEGIPVEKVGNASLLGSIQFAISEPLVRTQFIDALNKNRMQVELALQDDFQDIFVRNLNFI